jgi:hypothetical protein
MASAHENAVRFARQRSDGLARLFAQIGTSEHPRGQVLSAYRAARQALQGNLSNPLAIEDALGTLRLAVERATSEILQEAADLGLRQAEDELLVYGLPSPGVGVQTSEALKVVISGLEAQLQAVRALGLAGIDEAIVLGDAGRVGVLTHGPVVREVANWSALLAQLGYDQAVRDSLERSGGKEDYLRQAIAAVDQNTTETCLLINGQAVDLNGDFVLKGTPRFADEIHAPPFHWWCRTGIALVRRQDADDQLSREMREAGRAELRAREETGRTVEIWPSHARSGRQQ